MTPIPALDRVPIWNAFFRLAWTEAKAVFEAQNGCQVAETFSAGPTPVLPEDDFHVLALVVMCNLAIEARANHLIDELLEKGLIAKDVANAARQLPPKHKWFLLPTLAGKSGPPDDQHGPHQAVAQLCALRNDFIHVNYGSIRERLQDKGAMLSYFRRFCEAIDDMNLILGRDATSNSAVLGKGSFDCLKP